MERAVGRALLRLAGACALAVTVASLVDPRPPMIHPGHGQVLVATAVVAALAALVALARAGARRTRLVRRLRATPGARRLALAASLVLSVGGAAACTWSAVLLHYRTNWDVAVVDGISQSVTTGLPLTAYQASYLSRYPNTLALLGIDNLTRSIGDATGIPSGTVFDLLNGVCLALTLQACYALGAALRRREAGLAAQGLVLLLVGTSPWMTVSYTDVVSMPFTVGAVLFLVMVRHARSRARSALLLAAAALCAVVAYEIKSTPAVLVVAGTLYGLHEVVHRTGRRRRTAAVALAGGLAFVGAGLLAAGPVLDAAAKVPPGVVDRSRTPPTVWWFAMGTSERLVGGAVRYGAYDPTLVRLTSGMDAQDAGKVATAYLTTRMHDLGPGGYLRFVAEKAVFTWGDGMFWAWTEGGDWRAESYVSSPAADWVRSWNRPSGAWYPWRSAAATAVWSVLLLVAGARLLRAPLRRDVLLVALGVLGFAAFTLVFQGRSRYLLVAVPLVCLLAAVLPPAWRRRPRHPDVPVRTDRPARTRQDDGGGAGAGRPARPAARQPATVNGTPWAGHSPTRPPSTVRSGAPR